MTHVHDASFVAYIDESGDEGFNFEKGSSDWFVLSAAIFRRSEDLEQVKLINEVRERLNLIRRAEERIPDKKPLHFRDLKHEAKRYYVHRIAQANLHTITLMIHKPSLASSKERFKGFGLYFHAASLLVERISWHNRDCDISRDSLDGSTDLIFSNRATLDYEALKEHLSLKNKRIGRLETFSPGRRMGLQIADAVAGSYYYAVEPSAFGVTDDGYLRLLLPRAYRFKGSIWGYGVKIAPSEAEERRRAGKILRGIGEGGE